MATKQSMTRPCITFLPRNELPEVLIGIPKTVRDQINSTLCNDEVSSDEELLHFFTSQCGMSEGVAKAAIEFRPRFIIEVFFHLFDPQEP
jgi:hypothetical protein